MNFKHISFLSLLVVFANCSKDEQQAPNTNINQQQEKESEEPKSEITTYFTANISSEKDTDMSDDYLIIHDSNGKLIEFKTFEKGNSVIFDAYQDSITNSITVTHLSLPIRDEPRTFFLESYPDIKTGSVWNIKKNFINSFSRDIQNTGTFSIRISGNGERPIGFLISNGNGSQSRIETSDGFDDVWNVNYIMSIEDYVENYTITSLTPSGSSKYYIIENAQNNDSYDISYDDFSSFDTYIDFSSPSLGNTTVTLIGHKDENIVLGPNGNSSLGTGYDLYGLRPNDNLDVDTETLKIGFLENNFAAYSFFTSYFYNYGYTKKYFGAIPPKTLRILDKPESNISNYSLKNFNVSMELDYVRSTSYWSYGQPIFLRPEDSQTNWYIYASRDSYPPIGEFPIELIEKFPRMNLDELEYRQTTFMLDSFSYPEFIEKTFITQDIETIPRNEEAIILYSEL